MADDRHDRGDRHDGHDGHDRPAGVLLAAGAGTRLGTPKALVAVGGRPLVVRGAEMLRTAGCAPRIVVIGARADEVRTVLRANRVTHDVTVVQAPDWAEGQGHSMRVGLEAAAQAGAGAAVVALADQPLVTSAAVERLLHAWRSGAVAVMSTFDGHPRPPVLLDASVWSDVTGSLTGDEGAGAWLRTDPRTRFEEVGDVADGRDVDTPEELAAVNLMVGGTPWP